MKKLSVVSLFLSFAIGSLAGCGPSFVPVEGKVIVSGQPLNTGSVAFYPTAGSGQADAEIGTGDIGSDGSYKLMSSGKAGMPPGKYKVVVNASKPSNPDDQYSLPILLVDKKFTDLATTPLVVDVAAGAGAGKYDLNVTK